MARELSNAGRDAIRLKAEDRALGRIERLERAAEALVGELVRDGRTVFYINQRDRAGGFTGRTVEFATEGAAINFLLRNRYV